MLELIYGLSKKQVHRWRLTFWWSEVFWWWASISILPNHHHILVGRVRGQRMLQSLHGCGPRPFGFVKLLDLSECDLWFLCFLFLIIFPFLCLFLAQFGGVRTKLCYRIIAILSWCFRCMSLLFQSENGFKFFTSTSLYLTQTLYLHNIHIHKLTLAVRGPSEEQTFCALNRSHAVSLRDNQGLAACYC